MSNALNNESSSQDAETVTLNITIDSDVPTRKGTYADLVMVRTNRGTTMLDFVLNDIQIDGQHAQGALVARVFMSNESVVELRETLIRHTADWRISEGKPNGE